MESVIIVTVMYLVLNRLPSSPHTTPKPDTSEEKEDVSGRNVECYVKKS